MQQKIKLTAERAIDKLFSDSNNRSVPNDIQKKYAIAIIEQALASSVLKYYKAALNAFCCQCEKEHNCSLKCTANERRICKKRLQYVKTLKKQLLND